MGQKAEWRKKSDEGKGGISRWENVEEEKKRKTRGKGAGVEGVCNAILVSVNICCSACQGSIYQGGLTPGPLLEYWWGHRHRGAGETVRGCAFVCSCATQKKKRRNKEEFKEAEGWEIWARRTQDVCREQLHRAPQQCLPWPLFCFSRSHSGWLPWGQTLRHVWSSTHK